MKSTHPLGIIFVIVLLLAASLVVAAFHQPIKPASGLNSLVIQSKVTNSQTGSDLSVVGSTTGIFIMGAVIVLIISIPMIFRKKKR